MKVEKEEVVKKEREGASRKRSREWKKRNGIERRKGECEMEQSGVARKEEFPYVFLCRGFRFSALV